MAYVLLLPAAFFHSAFVPAQSVFSDQTADLTAYAWRPFPQAPDEELRLPCAAGEAEDWRLRTLGSYLTAGLFAVVGLVVLAFSQGQDANPKDSEGGLIFGLGLLVLGIWRAVLTGDEAVRLEARPDLQAVTIVWPPKLFFIYNVYAAALARWQQAGRPLAAEGEQDAGGAGAVRPEEDAP